MTLSPGALLSPDRRAALAQDENLGGGNVLRTAVRANPHPELAFLCSARSLAMPGGESRDEFSLLDLDALVQSWSAWYISQGVNPRDRVGLYFDDSVAYSVHYHALAQIGAISLHINSNVEAAAAAGLLKRTGATGLFTDRAHVDRLGGEAGRLPQLRWIETAERVPAPSRGELADTDYYRHHPDDPVALLHSSATTGVPKAVIYTHASMTAGPKFRLTHHTEPSGALMMTAQPQSHAGCIAYTCYAILAATPMVALYDPSGAELAAAVAKYLPTDVLAFGHSYAELAAVPTEPGSLDSVLGWVSMADAVHDAHIKNILGRRSPHLAEKAAFFDRFGTTELGWGLMVRRHTLASPRLDRCIGRPDPLAEVNVLRLDGSVAPAGEIGLLGAKSPTLTAGYWNDSDTTYRSKLAGHWLSGDLAYRDENGDYFMVDRAVDAIPAVSLNRRGSSSGLTEWDDPPTASGYKETRALRGYSVLMEELLLNEIPEIVDCAVVAGCYQGCVVPVAVVVATDGSEPKRLLAAANQVLRAAGQPDLHLIELARAGTTPLGPTGKVLKRQLRERYANLERYRADDSVVAAAGVGTPVVN